MARKYSQKKKSFSLSKLEKTAFPDHVVSLSELREAAYAEELGEPVPEQLCAHIRGCAFCREQLAMLRQSDPILTGEDQSRVKVLVQAVERPALAHEIEVKAQGALAAAAARYGSNQVIMAAEIVSGLTSAEEEPQEKEDDTAFYETSAE